MFDENGNYWTNDDEAVLFEDYEANNEEDA